MEILVRDFAYAPGDPRHEGREAPQQLYSVPSSSNSDNSDDGDEHQGTLKTKTCKETSFMTTLGRDDRVSLAYPRFSNLLSPLIASSGTTKLSVYHARALYSFAKGSDWEMDLETLEDVAVIIEEPVVFVNVHPPPSQDSKHPLLSKSSSKSMGNLSGRFGAANGLKTGHVLSCSGLAVPTPVHQDRWASLDDDHESDRGAVSQDETLRDSSKNPVSDSGHAHSLDQVLGSKSAHTATTTALPTDSISLTLDPCLSDFAETLKKFMDHSKDYGSGWATALRLKIKGSLQGAGQKTRGKIQLRLDDIGLVPENYIERIQAPSPAPQVASSGHSKFPSLK